MVESAIARAPDYAHALPYPVAAKILSAEIAHKTDVGRGGARDQGSRRNSKGKDRHRDRRRRRTAPGADAWKQGLAEAIVGYRDDPVVGPLVMVGAGGILAELYNDVVLRLAPVDEAGALEMIGQVKGFAVLRGYRGLPQGDLQALARAVAAMSRLALACRPAGARGRGESGDREGARAWWRWMRWRC